MTDENYSRKDVLEWRKRYLDRMKKAEKEEEKK